MRRFISRILLATVADGTGEGSPIPAGQASVISRETMNASTLDGKSGKVAILLRRISREKPLLSQFAQRLRE
jgi:hypothetical protein